MVLKLLKIHFACIAHLCIHRARECIKICLFDDILGNNVGGSNHLCLFVIQSENNPSEHLKSGQQGTKGLFNNCAVGQWYGRYSGRYSDYG